MIPSTLRHVARKVAYCGTTALALSFILTYTNDKEDNNAVAEHQQDMVP